MEIESGFSAALDVVTRCKGRKRYGFGGSFSFRFCNDIVAIPVWQRDITQHNVELFGVNYFQRAPGVISRGNVVAEMIQEPRQRLERVAVILYDEDPQTLARIILRPRSILAHLANPAKPYNRILRRVHMQFGRYRNITVGKTSGAGAGSWLCIGVLLMYARRCF